VAKKPHVSPSTLAYMERKLASVEHRRSNPPSAADIARILAEMQSPDEQRRAHAVQQVCPCRVPWDMFRQLRKEAQRLRKDPSPMVRANARHVEEDAREIEALEALREWITERVRRSPRVGRRDGVGIGRASKSQIKCAARSRNPSRPTSPAVRWRRRAVCATCTGCQYTVTV
jgi:hypothetical protein